MAVAKKFSRKTGSPAGPKGDGSQGLNGTAKKAVELDSDSAVRLQRYEQFFTRVQSFLDQVDQCEQRIEEATEAVDKAKLTLDAAKNVQSVATSERDAAKHALYRLMRPAGKGDALPLFDRMEPADEEVHGVGSTKWREEPLSALRLSMSSVLALTAMDVIFVGQLQDRVMAKPGEWWLEFPGLSAGAAAAVVDRLNDFIFERTPK